MPSQVIPLWREFERYRLKSPHIGVDFSDCPSIGVGFRAFPLCSFVSFVVKGVGFFWLEASG